MASFLHFSELQFKLLVVLFRPAIIQLRPECERAHWVDMQLGDSGDMCEALCFQNAGEFSC